MGATTAGALSGLDGGCSTGGAGPDLPFLDENAEQAACGLPVAFPWRPRQDSNLEPTD